jgi:hypothetical protein
VFLTALCAIYEQHMFSYSRPRETQVLYMYAVDTLAEVRNKGQCLRGVAAMCACSRLRCVAVVSGVVDAICSYLQK